MRKLQHYDDDKERNINSILGAYIYIHLYLPNMYIYADPSSRAINGKGLKPMAYWDRGFESRWGH
jgi:hypothetical protein